MTYQHFFRCSVCECKETVQQQAKDGTWFEECLNCGFPLKSFVPDLEASIIGLPDEWHETLPFTEENGDCSFAENGDLR